jgi:signal transduction histidine kinase
MNVRVLRALVVEDDPLDLAVLEQVASRIDGDLRLEVVPCADPAAAPDRAREGFDVVLLDYQLGALDGLGVLEALRRSGDETPVIFVTGAEDVHVASRAIRAGAFDYLLKPELTPDALRHAVLGAVRAREAERERRALERRVRMLERMDAAALLAGGVAHDFNNILTGITGWAGIAVAEALPGADLEPLRHIAAAAERAGALVKKLLEATHGGGDDAVAPVPLASLARAVTDALAGEARPGIRVELEVPDGDPLVVPGDRDRLETAIRNLVLNGVEAMPSGGRLVVRLRREAPDLGTGAGVARRPAMAVVEVEDEGRGIRPEIRERIFDAYFTTKDAPSQKGLGLGLTLALRIARAHRGALDFESRPGRTVFRLKVPLSIPVPPATALSGPGP